ncbi:MAG: polysaccharide deacetylase family protein [Bdellovibrionota bacterium]
MKRVKQLTIPILIATFAIGPSCKTANKMKTASRIKSEDRQSSIQVAKGQSEEAEVNAIIVRYFNGILETITTIPGKALGTLKKEKIGFYHAGTDKSILGKIIKTPISLGKNLINRITSLTKSIPNFTSRIILAPFNKDFLEPFIKTQKLAFKKMYKFDEQLEEAVRACQNNGECKSPIYNKNYAEALYYRSKLETIKHKLAYFYIRLFDIANSVATVTNHILPKPIKFTTGQAAQLAQLIIHTLDAEMYKIIEQTNIDDVDAAMKKWAFEEFLTVRNRALNTLYILAGANTVCDTDSKDNCQLYLSKAAEEKQRSEYLSIKAEFEATVNKEEDNINPKDLEMFEQQQQANKVAWANHTGRSFNAGDWALTFDDGPRDKTTKEILKQLEDHNFHATFFWLAKNAGANKESVRLAKAKGMELASHSYTHADLSKASADLNKEIVEAKKVLESVYERQVDFFRLPYGAGTKSQRVKDTITGLGMQHFFWNVDSLDWKDPDPKSIVARIKKQMQVQKKGIILMHDIHQKTVSAATILMKDFKKSGINVVNLREAIGNTDEPQNLPPANGENDTTPAPADRFVWTVGGTMLPANPDGSLAYAIMDLFAGEPGTICFQPEDNNSESVNAARDYVLRDFDKITRKYNPKVAGQTEIIVEVDNPLDPSGHPREEFTFYSCKETSTDDFQHFRVIIASKLNLRSDNNTNNKPCGKLIQNQTVKVEEITANGWYKISPVIQDQGCVYISADPKYSAVKPYTF